jgi:L-aspartate oxidase
VIRQAAVSAREELVPLTLAAHHGTGGVAIDAWGRTSLPGLYACGEAAGGVQGAARTMGTGLIEARLFGARVADAAVRDVRRMGPAGAPDAGHTVRTVEAPEEMAERLDRTLGPLLLGFDGAAVGRALAQLEAWRAASAPHPTLAAWRTALRRAAAVETLRAAETAHNGPVTPAAAR